MNLPGRIPLATRLGRQIPNEQCPDRLPHQAEMLNAKFKQQFPQARLRRQPTGQYNCHGLTFANRRTRIVETDEERQITLLLRDIFKDDGYCDPRGNLKTVHLHDLRPGDVVVYFDGDEIEHTGIIVWVDRDRQLVGGGVAWVLSKWADAGEYDHPASHCPYHNPTFVTER